MIDGGKAVAGVAWLLLAGCTAQPGKPSSLPPAPSPSASPSAAPSPSASPRARPHGTDVQQIAALARDYYEESNRAFRTGDTARLRSLSTGNCQCLAAIVNAEQVWKAGSIVCPKYYNIKSVARPTVTSATSGFATIIYNINKSTFLDKAGKVIQTFPADSKLESASLDFVKLEGAWKVSLVSINQP